MDMRIENDRPQHDFEIIPRRLMACTTLSPTARLALMLMCTKPRGWIMRVSEIRRELGIGDHAWRRVSAELRNHGCMELVTGYEPDTGRVLGSRIRVTWAPFLQPPKDGPTETSETNASGHRDVGFPRVGNRRDSASETDGTSRRKPTDLLQRERKDARARATPGQHVDNSPSPAPGPRVSTDRARDLMAEFGFARPMA